MLIPCFLVAVAGCTVGPDYTPPTLDTVPAAWSAAPAGADVDPTAELAVWWERLGDPQLTALVQRAVRGNLDLRVAEARALRGIRAARLWPQLDTGGTLSPAAGNTQAVFLAALDAIWEIDVFGGVRRSVEAADADIEASVEARQAVLLDLTGAVAATYIELRGLQGRIAAARGNLEAQRETMELTAAQRHVGVASDLDVDRARALVFATAAELLRRRPDLGQAGARAGGGDGAHRRGDGA